MSKTIDERVVSMQFDNKNFEANVKTSMSTIEKLKKSLNFSGASKGLESVSAAAKKCDLSPIGSAVEGVKVKFSAMEVMAVTALANITNSAVNMAKRTIAAFTVDPVKTGFQEYELKMGSIQTIMASTGESLETVNKYLNELNEYSDKTIYSFSDMTTNIGKFTNAGVKLEDAVLAIKGVSNEAAVSGANANEASRAMYNFAQALSAGYVKLIDWKSIENANMATVEFKNQLIDTAVEVGTLTKTTDGYRTSAGKVITATSNFNESLTDQWMTTDVLIKTLKNYADETTDIGKKAYASAQDVKTFSMMMDTLKESAQSGWAATWEIIIGDFEEAKQMWTNITNFFDGVISRMSDRRNAIFSNALGSKWNKLNEYIESAGVSVSDFEKKLKETAREHGYEIDRMIKEQGSLAKVFASGKISGSLIIETLKKFIGVGEKVSKTTEDVTNKLEYFQEVFDKTWRGDFGNGSERMNKLTEAGYDYAEVQGLINKLLEEGHGSGYKLTLEDIADLNDAQLKSVGYTDDQIAKLRELASEAERTGTPLNELIKSLEKPTGRELFIESVQNIFGGLVKVIKSIGKAWNEVFNGTPGSGLYSFIEGLNKLSEAFIVGDDTAKNITRTFKGLFSILKILRNVATGGISLAFKILNKVLNAFDLNILDVTAAIGDMLTKLGDWIEKNDYIGKAIQKVADVIVYCYKAIRKWIDSFLDLPIVKRAMTDFKGAISDTFGALGEFFSKGIKVIGDFIDRCKKLDGITPDNIKKAFEDFGKSVFGYFANIGDCFEPLKKATGALYSSLKPYIEGIVQLFESLKNGIVSAFEFIKDTLSNIDFGSLIGVGIGVGTFVMVKKLLVLLGNLSKPLEALTIAADGFSKVCKAMSTNIKSKAMKNVAESILILVGALWILTNINPDRLWESMGVLTILVGLLIGITVAISLLVKRANGKDIAGLAGYLVGLGGCMLLMAWCMKIIAGIPDNGIGKALGIVTAFSIIVLALIGISKIPGADGPAMQGTAKLIRKLATTLLIMVAVMAIVGMLPDGVIGKGLGVITAFSLLIIALVGVSKFASAVDTAGLAKLIGKFGTTLLLLVVVIKLIAGINPADILKGLIVIGALEALIVGLVAATRLVGDKRVDDIGPMIAKIGLALLMMVVVMKIAARMSVGDIAKGLLVVAALEALIVGLMFASKLASGGQLKGMASVIMSLGIALIGMATALAIISLIKPDGLIRAVGVITVLSLLLGALIVAMHKAQNVKSALVVLTIMIGMLAGFVIALTFLDQEDLRSATLSLSMVLGVLSLFLVACKKLKMTTTGIGSLAGIMIVMIATVYSLATIIKILADIEPGNAIASASALSIVLMAIAGAVRIIGPMKDISLEAVIAAALLVLVVGVIGFVLAKMTDLNVQNAIPNAVALSTLLISLSASLVLIAAAGTFGPAVWNGLAALGVLVLGLAAIMTAIAFLVQDAKAAEAGLDTAIMVLGKLGEGLGAFVGGFVKGVAEMIMSTLPALATNLSQFMINLLPFITIAKMIDGSVLSACGIIVGCVAAITATSIMDSIATFLSFGQSPMQKFANNVKIFGYAMCDFSKIVSGHIDSDAVEAAASAGKMMAEMNSTIPSSGGVVGFFAGEKDLKKFSLQLLLFGHCIVEFSKIVKGKVDADAVTAAASAGKMMAEMADTIPNSGGVVGFFAGNNDMDKFGIQLVIFGHCMVEFSKTVRKRIDSDAVEAAASAGKMMAEMADTIPNSGGVVGFFTGNNDIATFGIQLVMFGRAMATFSRTVRGRIDSESVMTAAMAGKMMAEMADTIPNSGGLVDFFAGSNDLAGFGEQLAWFGEAMVAFSDTVSGGLDKDAMMTAIDAAMDVIKMAKKLPEDMDVYRISYGLDSLAEAMIVFSDKISGSIDEKAVTACAYAGKAVAEMAAIMPDEVNLARITNGLDEFGTAMVGLSEIVEEGIDVSAIKDATDAGTALADMISHIPEYKNVVGFSGTADQVAQAIKNFNDELKDSGIDYTSMTDYIIVAEDLVSVLTTVSSYEYKSVAGLVENSKKVAQSIATFADTLNNSKTELQAAALTDFIIVASDMIDMLTLVSGYEYKDITGFSGMADQVARAIINFASVIKNDGTELDPASIDEVIAIAGSLSDLISTVSNFEYKDITGFSGTANQIAQAIINFASTLKSDSSGLDSETMSSYINLADSLIALITKVSDYEYKDITGFISNTNTVASAIVNFFKKINDGGIDTAMIENATSAGTKITELVKSLPEYVDITGVIGNFEKAGSAIKTFCEKVEGVDTSYVESATTSGVKIVELIKKIPEYKSIVGFVGNASQVGQAIKTFTEELKSVGLDDVTSIVDGFSTLMESLEELGTKSVEGFVKAFEDGKTNVTSKISDLVSAAVNALGKNDLHTNFYAVGKYASEGLANGITANAYKAIAAAKKVAKAVIAIMKDAFDENSPSKETYEIGAFAGMGLVNSLKDYEGKATRAGYDLADSAKTGLSKAISKVQDLITNGMDSQPSIRPVLDLSDIESGAETIGSMLSMTPSIGMLSRVSGISSMMNYRQNGNDSEIISAIKDLGKKIGNTSGNTYNVNGITYDDGSNVSDAIRVLVRAAKVERRS